MIYVCIATTKERRARLEKCLEAIRNSTFKDFSIVVYENSDGGCVLATKKMIAGLNGLIFLLNDDMIVEPDCIQKLYEAWTKLPNTDGMVIQPWENMHDGELGVSPFCHTDTIRPFLEHYTHNFWDTEFTIRKRLEQKYGYVPNAKIDHQHVIKDQSLQDETYALSQATFEKDKELFRQRATNDFK